MDGGESRAWETETRWRKGNTERLRALPTASARSHARRVSHPLLALQPHAQIRTKITDVERKHQRVRKASTDNSKSKARAISTHFLLYTVLFESMCRRGLRAGVGDNLRTMHEAWKDAVDACDALDIVKGRGGTLHDPTPCGRIGIQGVSTWRALRASTKYGPDTRE